MWYFILLFLFSGMKQSKSVYTTACARRAMDGSPIANGRPRENGEREREKIVDVSRKGRATTHEHETDAAIHIGHETA